MIMSDDAEVMAKKLRTENSEDAQMDSDDLEPSPPQPEPPLTAVGILALFKQAIREEGLPRKDDFVSLETRVDEKLSASKAEIEDQMGALPRQVDRTVEALASKVSKFESRLSSGSGASSTTSAGSPTWADRPKSSQIDRSSGWVPRTLFIREWGPLRLSDIPENLDLLLDDKVRVVCGSVCDDLVSLPGYVCNHQIAYRLKDASPRSLYDIKADLAARLEAGGVWVRGQPLRVVVEQSPQRKLECGQFARALDEIRAEPDMVWK